MDKAIYTIDQLGEKTGFSRRTIRYYVEIGLIDPPAGRGKGGFYNDSHLTTLLAVKRLQDKGLSLSAIMDYLKKGEVSEDRASVDAPPLSYSREVWVEYEIQPGMVLSVRRDIEEQENKKVSEIVRFAKMIAEEGLKHE